MLIKWHQGGNAIDSHRKIWLYMENLDMHKSLLAWLVLLALWTSPSAQGQSPPAREGFRFGLDLGVGSVERTIAGTGIDDSKFYMGFVGSYWIGQHVLAGLDLNGWLLQSSNLKDPTVGEGISRIFITAKIYPGMQSGWFVKAGGGYISHWNNRPGETRRKSGSGFEVGGGYDFVSNGPGKPWVFTPFLTYGSGETGDEEHNAFTIGVGIAWQF